MKNIILSSLSLFSIDRLHSWWEASNQTVIFNASIGNSISVVITLNNNQEKVLTNHNRGNFYTCLGSFDLEQLQQTANKLPCITYSASKSSLRIDADPHGFLPVWFEIIDSEASFIVTTDNTVGRLASFSSLAAVGAGTSLTIDLKTLEVDDISIPIILQLTEIVGYSFYADIGAAFERAASTMISLPTTAIAAEYDALSFSSKLLHCWLHNSQLYDAKFVPRVPLTIDYDLKVLFADHPKVAPIIDFIPNDGYHSSLRSERPWQLFYEQYQLCSPDKTHISFSFHNFYEIDPLRVYFRSLLCSLLGTTLVNPYAGLTPEHAAYHLTKSDFNMLVELEFHAGRCQGDPYESRSFVIDEQGVYTTIGPPAITRRKDAKVEEEGKEEDKWKIEVQQTASKHSTDMNITVLLLATYGYFDMLHNFLCHAHSLFPNMAAATTAALPFVILTNDPRIVELAHSFGAGAIQPHPDTKNSSSTIAAADFGTVDYQLLMLSRTKMALDLLYLGFSPLIADIDTVWLRNPLSLTELKKQQDMFIVNDGEEVCGCFVLLHPSANTIHFWSVVYEQHTQLLKHAAEQKLESLGTESEQKILTRLIYQRQYQRDLKVFLLPASYFPDGRQYFIEWPGTVTTAEEVYVVHNNFIISKEMKQVRFERYGLWQYSRLFNGLNHANYGLRYCRIRSKSNIFDLTRRIDYIKTINIATPIHNTITKKSNLSVCVTFEGLPANDLRVVMNSAQASVRSFGLIAAQLVAGDRPNGGVEDPHSWSLIFTDQDPTGSNLESFVDVAQGKEHFSIDYGENITLLKKAHDEINFKYAHDSYWQEEKEVKCLPLQYHIKVLTMLRAKSLHRLLTSLANADYHSRLDVNLEIFVDGVRQPEESSLQTEVIQVAQDFIWLHGTKTITIRESNYGLASQWYYAWTPTANTELAFIFEDDLEVSRYYFTWASQSAERYYGCSNLQRKKQYELFMKIKTQNNSSNINETNSFDEFIHDYAGFPLMYGVCLQRQYLAPNHSPFKMQLRNGYRPYLYSLVGSWGPLFFPFMWEAFRNWWRMNDGTAPMTSSLITNRFMQSNPGIWTPYLVRFAYEFGVKCLYANLPGNLTLVNNYREVGENYGQHMGPYARLLDGEILQYVIPAVHDRDDIKSFERRNEVDYHALQAALNIWPTMSELSRWQIDFNLRRHGSYGSYSPFPMLVKEDGQLAIDWFETIVEQYYNPIATMDVPKLTSTHWVEVVNLIEAVLSLHEKVLSIETNPLMKILPTRMQTSFYLSSYSDICAALNVTLEKDCIQLSKVIIDVSSVHIAMLALFPSLLSEKLVVNVLAGSEPIRYLLVIDTCSAAPTIIALQYRHITVVDGIAVHSSDRLEQYVIVEDVCNSHPVDHGVVLYRLQEDLFRFHGKDVTATFDSDNIPGVAISKRLSDSMTTRRMVDRSSNLFHIKI